MTRYAGVIVDINVDAVDKIYTYAVPGGMNLTPGQRVLAPFGGRKIEGFVVRLDECTDLAPEKIKPIIRPLENYPVILPEMIELARWMQEKYYCTLTAALRLMMPAQLRGDRVREKKANVAQLLVSGAALEDAIASRTRAPRQASVLESLKAGPMRVSVLGARVEGASQVLRTLEKQGLVSISEETVMRRPQGESTRGRVDPPLTQEQQSAAERMTQAMNQSGGRFLLMGVTGSGKTEVYIQLIRQALKTGRGAIVLVPEIALTPQMVDWFRSRFGEGAAVLHSRLSPGERFDEWRRIRTGEARVVVGARSAVFAPVERLGMIVIDEEHEHSYQSDKRPRYDAREVARYRAEKAGAILVMGSATPSIASFMKTMPGVKAQNRFELVELRERVFGRPMPEVEIVDMTEELSRGNHSIFSVSLQEALSRCLDEGHQAMLMINRRGYSTFVSCRKCGHVEKCEMCDVSMTYHQSDGVLKCHYCGATRTPPTKCPACGSNFIKFFGTGTQKVEEAVKQLLPHARVARMDMDTTRGKDAHELILSAFAAGHTDILIGTQMIAKGLDFANVTLVGVIAADMTLNLPDYRASERTFQLITQVAGRAGRASLPGQVVVQSYEPDHYAIQLAAKQDYRAFYHEEVTHRRRGLYPPYTVMARLLVSGKEPEQVQQAAQAMEERLNQLLDQGKRRENVIQMRALEAPIGRLRGEARWQVFIKLYARSDSEDILLEMENLSHEMWDEVKVELEINPANMY